MFFLLLELEKQAEYFSDILNEDILENLNFDFTHQYVFRRKINM